jgi:hypothetical protein
LFYSFVRQFFSSKITLGILEDIQLTIILLGIVRITGTDSSTITGVATTETIDSCGSSTTIVGIGATIGLPTDCIYNYLIILEISFTKIKAHSTNRSNPIQQNTLSIGHLIILTITLGSSGVYIARSGMTTGLDRRSKQIFYKHPHTHKEKKRKGRFLQN